MSAQPFADLPVIGALPRDAAAAKLREVGEDAAADAVERASPPPKTMRAGGWWPFSNRAWQQRIASAFCRLAAQADARKSSASARRKPMRRAKTPASTLPSMRCVLPTIPVADADLLKARRAHDIVRSLRQN
jgi:hypothetical protein